MRKNTFIYLLEFNFFLWSCKFNDVKNHTKTSEKAQVKKDNFLVKSSLTYLAFITHQLANSYKANFNYSSMSVYEKIKILYSAALDVPLFTAMKPVNLKVPGLTNVQVLYLNNYNNFYSVFNVCEIMKGYIELIMQKDIAYYSSILQSIKINSRLTENEKSNLQFILTYIQDTVSFAYGRHQYS